jgi:inactivated superfamily I helicase
MHVFNIPSSAPFLRTLITALVDGDLVEGFSARGAPEKLASTLALADDLARLMDDMATRKVDWSALDGLVPDALDQYWQLTLQFLSIARNVWPDILAAHNAIEPAVRRDLLIDAEASRLKAHKGGPIIAAGSTARKN